MAGIKVGAHPMVVAVAMGLLGPGVLFDDGSDAPKGRSPNAASPFQEPAEPISADEFARVESLWHEVTLDP